MIGVLASLLLALTVPTNNTPATPTPPSGYVQTYGHNFTKTKLEGWNIEYGNSAPVKLGPSSGLGVSVTAPGQWTEVESDGTPLVDNSFMQARVYFPGVGGAIANFPAFWAFSSVASEIDSVEGLGGTACAHTHYANANTAVGICAPPDAYSGWHTYTTEWTGSKVTFWYDNYLLGSQDLPVSQAYLKMPVTTPQRLLFQNRSYTDAPGSCPSCYGPALYGNPSTAWLQWVKIWSKPRTG
jgi:hypothetical protein